MHTIWPTPSFAETDAFRARYVILPNGCFEWQPKRLAKFEGNPISKKTYYCCVWRKKRWKVHRLSLVWHLNGQEELGAHVLHGCGYHLCVNPLHLRFGTHAENMRDAVLHGTRPKGGEHWNHTLSEKEVVLIWSDYYEHKMNMVEISKKFTVSRSTVQAIIESKNWNHVTKFLIKKHQRGRSGEDCSGSKLKEADVLKIWDMYYREGLAADCIRKCYGITRSGVSHIVCGRKWSYLTKGLSKHGRLRKRPGKVLPDNMSQNFKKTDLCPQEREKSQ